MNCSISGEKGGVRMNLTWITGRTIGADLAGATEVGLSKSLTSRNNKVHMISPSTEDFEGIDDHTLVKQSIITGLKSISMGSNVRKIISADKSLWEWTDIFLIDWRLVTSLRKEMRRKEAKWCIVDRGPPANMGIIANLQKIQWKRAWNISETDALGGFVVSIRHEEFVRAITGVDMDIRALPAGTNSNSFSGTMKNPDGHVRFVYSGQLDYNRDIEGMFKLIEHFNLISADCSMLIMGKGELSPIVKDLADSSELVDFYGHVPVSRVWEELEKSHVGILPMPRSGIWETSSPIKLAEYLAAGLLTIGPKHDGNDLQGENNWSLLSENDAWQLDCLEKINRVLSSGQWSNFSEEAIHSAKFLDWDIIAEEMDNSLEEWLGSS